MHEIERANIGWGMMQNRSSGTWLRCEHSVWCLYKGWQRHPKPSSLCFQEASKTATHDRCHVECICVEGNDKCSDRWSCWGAGVDVNLKQPHGAISKLGPTTWNCHRSEMEDCSHNPRRVIQVVVSILEFCGCNCQQLNNRFIVAEVYLYIFVSWLGHDLIRSMY